MTPQEQQDAISAAVKDLPPHDLEAARAIWRTHGKAVFSNVEWARWLSRRFRWELGQKLEGQP